MARGTRTVYPGKRNKGLSSTFLPPEEGRGIQRPKRCYKHGDKDEDNSPKNVNNVIHLTYELSLSFSECLSVYSYLSRYLLHFDQNYLYFYLYVYRSHSIPIYQFFFPAPKKTMLDII